MVSFLYCLCANEALFSTVSLSCGQSSAENCTYIVQEAVTAPPESNCVYSLCPSNREICRMRFDFMVSTYSNNRIVFNNSTGWQNILKEQAYRFHIFRKICISTVNNKKNTYPRFSTLRFSRISPEPLHSSQSDLVKFRTDFPAKNKLNWRRIWSLVSFVH